MRMNNFNTNNDANQNRLTKILTNASGASVDIELAFAEVQHKARKNAFKERGLHESKTHQPDLRHLLGIKPDKHKRLLPKGCDHESLWVDANGVPQVFVFQPYELTNEEIIGNIELCNQLGLKMQISAANSWHCAGRTLLVGLQRKEPISIHKSKHKKGVAE